MNAGLIYLKYYKFKAMGSTLGALKSNKKVG